MDSVIFVVIISTLAYFFISAILSKGEFNSEDSRKTAIVLFRIIFSVVSITGLIMAISSDIRNYKFQKEDETFRAEQKSIMAESDIRNLKNEPVKQSIKIITKQDRINYAENLKIANNNDGIQCGVFTGMNGNGNNDDLEFWSYRFDNKSAKSYLNGSELQESWRSLGFKTVEVYNTSTHEHWILNLSTNKIKYKKS